MLVVVLPPVTRKNPELVFEAALGQEVVGVGIPFELEAVVLGARDPEAMIDSFSQIPSLETRRTIARELYTRNLRTHILSVDHLIDMGEHLDDDHGFNYFLEICSDISRL